MGPGKETVDYTLGSKTAKNYLNYSFLIKAWEALKDNRFSLNRIKKIPERYDLSQNNPINKTKQILLNICFNFIIVHTKYKVVYANLNGGTEWKCRDCIRDISAEVKALVYTHTHSKFPNSTDWDSGQDWAVIFSHSFLL